MIRNYGLDIQSSKYCILDEGDKMLYMGFQQYLEEIKSYMESAQTMIFSATVPQYIQSLARKRLKDPILIDLVGQDTSQIPTTIENKLVICENDAHKQKMLKDFILNNSDKKMIIFCETKRDCAKFEEERWAKFLPIHGDLT